MAKIIEIDNVIIKIRDGIKAKNEIVNGTVNAKTTVFVNMIHFVYFDGSKRMGKERGINKNIYNIEYIFLNSTI